MASKRWEIREPLERMFGGARNLAEVTRGVDPNTRKAVEIILELTGLLHPDGGESRTRLRTQRVVASTHTHTRTRAHAHAHTRTRAGAC